jgi:hypothetical protein
MQLENAIVVLSEEGVELYRNFKKMCEVKKYPYHTFKYFKFPITIPVKFGSGVILKLKIL